MSFKIVVPTDFSDASTAVHDWVHKLVAGLDAEAHLINVAQEPAMYFPVMSGAIMESMPSESQLQQLAEEILDDFAARKFGDLGKAPVKVVRVGRPADEICAYAKQIGADMIIIATRGRSGLTHVLLGSTAEAVVRQAECPVLTVRGAGG